MTLNGHFILEKPFSGANHRKRSGTQCLHGDVERLIGRYRKRLTGVAAAENQLLGSGSNSGLLPSPFLLKVRDWSKTFHRTAVERRAGGL